MGGRRQVTRPCLRNICLSLDYVYSIPRPRKVTETLRAHCLKKLLLCIENKASDTGKGQGQCHGRGFKTKLGAIKSGLTEIRGQTLVRPGRGKRRKERWRLRNRAGFGRDLLSPAFSLPVFLWWNTGLPWKLPPAGDELRLISQQVLSHCARTQEKAPIS